MLLYICFISHTDVDSILDVTQQWKEIELKSQPYIVHLRYAWEACSNVSHPYIHQEVIVIS